MNACTPGWNLPSISSMTPEGGRVRRSPEGPRARRLHFDSGAAPTPLNALTPPLHSNRLDREFSEVRKIACGSFSEVFKAVHAMDGLAYAVKRSRDTLAARTEIQILSKLDNSRLTARPHHIIPNFVRYYTAWCEKGAIFMQMELCEGTATRQHQHARQVFRDVSHGLAYIHALEIVHFDVKPGNILLSNGTWKLGDFGLAVDLTKCKTCIA